MDKNRAIELIKSFVLGCLVPENEASLKSFMEDTENFPWKELGQYQNLAALIPVNLKIVAPRVEVKDKVARMLYELKEAAESSQNTQAVSFDEPVSELEDIQLEETTFNESLPIMEEQEIITGEPLPELVEDYKHSDDFTDFQEKTEIPSDENILVKAKTLAPTPKTEIPEKKSAPPAEEYRRGGKMKEIMEREDFEKRTKEYINAYYQKKFEDLQEETKKALYIAIAGIALATIAAILAIVL